MNLNRNPTAQELSDLIGACDDRAGHHVVWVSIHGDVHVSIVPGEQNPIGFERAQSEMQMRYETFIAGNGYVGPAAAKDSNFVNGLLTSLLNAWKYAEGASEVMYIDH